jgi:uracil-DNA glycosylase family 4
LSLIESWNQEIIACRKCPRLVEWRESVAETKRKSFADESYWGKPVPYFGDPDAKLLILGLAPAAHGANRTGRMFTGDRSGDWLYRALHRAGLASQATATDLNDGLKLTNVLIAASCHCAPPDNKPLPEELENCNPFLRRMLASRNWDGILCLGGIAWTQLHRTLGLKGPKFAHGTVHQSKDTRIVASYHPSQQNTFTGRLTEEMLDQAVQLWQG